MVVVVTAELQSQARLYASQQSQALSAEQLAFSEPASGTCMPMALIAAAGSGKTESLVARLEWTLRNCAIGERLQIISFSNSAAIAFQARFESRWNNGKSLRVASTLHSWVKSDILLPHVGPEHRVSLIIERGAECIQAWSIERMSQFARGLHLFVDEAQDCDDSQWRLLNLLKDRGARIVVVGDPRQAIYGFQGARPDGLVRIHDVQAQARLVLNRRSTGTIVDLANIIASTSIPSCPSTGLESELAYAQQTPAGVLSGESVSLHYVKSIAYYSLKAVWVQIMASRRAHPLCVLTWTNSDALRLHHGLWLLGYQTLAILSRDGVGGEEPLPKDLRPDGNASDVVHVRTIHSCKGEGYDTIVFHIRGFATQEEATSSFEDSSTGDRREELRRYYVACTRAKLKLHVIIQGLVAPLWWTAIAERAKVLIRAMSPPKYLTCAASFHRNGSPEAAPSMPVRTLCCKYLATDSLLTYLDRAKTALSCGVNMDRRGSILVDYVESLQGAKPLRHIPDSLKRLKADVILGRVMSKFLFYSVFAPDAVRSWVSTALAYMERIPLDMSCLSGLKSWAHIREEDLFSLLAHRLASFVEEPTLLNFDELKAVLCQITRKVSWLHDAMPSHLLNSGNAFQEIAGGASDHKVFHIGAPESISRRHIAQTMRKRIFSDGMTGVSIAELFRKRTVFDAAALSACRSVLIDNSKLMADVSSRRLATPSEIVAGGLLCEFTGIIEGATLECGDLARVVPYLGNPKSSAASLCIKGDCLEQFDLLDEISSQARALREKLLTWHTACEIEQCTLEQYPEREIDGAPGTLTGFVPLFIPSHDYPERIGTCVFMVWKSQLCPEDETESLVSARLQCAEHSHRVAIVSQSEASVHVYVMKESENAAWAATRVWAGESLPLQKLPQGQ